MEFLEPEHLPKAPKLDNAAPCPTDSVSATQTPQKTRPNSENMVRGFLLGFAFGKLLPICGFICAICNWPCSDLGGPGSHVSDGEKNTGS